MALSDLMAGLMANPPGQVNASPDALREQVMNSVRSVVPSNILQKMPDIGSLLTLPPGQPADPPTMPQFGGFADGFQHRARAAFANRFPNGPPSAPTSGRWGDRVNRFQGMF